MKIPVRNGRAQANGREVLRRPEWQELFTSLPVLRHRRRRALQPPADSVDQLVHRRAHRRGAGLWQATKGLMEQPPRKVNDPIITKPVALRLLYQGVVMTVGILALRQWAEGAYGDATVAATMSLAAFVFYHIINGLENNHRSRSVFSMETFENRNQNLIMLAVVGLLILGVEMNLFQRLLDTTHLTFNQWMIALLVALPLLLFEEILKFFLRRREKGKKA